MKLKKKKLRRAIKDLEYIEANRDMIARAFGDAESIANLDNFLTRLRGIVKPKLVKG